MPVPADPADPGPATFRLVIVPGVTVNRWTRTWSERVPSVDLRVVPAEAAGAPALLATGADAGLLRLPVDQDTFHAVPLYTETTVVVVPREHLVAAADEVTMADLADETLLRPLDDVLHWADLPAAAAADADRPASTAAAVALVAAELGVLVVPQSLARAHHRRDVTHRVVTDAPTSSVGLVWPRDGYTDLVEEMIGIVRGRTANSTRGRAQTPTDARQPADPPPGPRRSGTRGGARGGTRGGGPNPRTPSRRRGR